MLDFSKWKKFRSIYSIQFFEYLCDKIVIIQILNHLPSYITVSWIIILNWPTNFSYHEKSISTELLTLLRHIPMLSHLHIHTHIYIYSYKIYVKLFSLLNKQRFHQIF